MFLECITIFLFIFITETRTIIIKTKLGNVEGNILVSSQNQNFYAFRGIRYAQPPVGPLRFKDPIPITPWIETFDATDDGPICPQIGNKVQTSEDCLRINIYTKQLPTNKNNNLKSVIVHIPGGAFVKGGSHSQIFSGPDYMMNRDIVFISFNYRLGPLGFLSTGTKDSSGNFGFKDQVMALKWVQENVAEFGGNPNSVTILGHSAGAVSVTFHLVSPMSDGLFHKAIAMSGAGTAQWELPKNQMQMIGKLASYFMCPTSNSTQIVDCLRNVSADEIVNTGHLFDQFAGNPILTWGPAIEDDFGQERFLTEHPTKSLQFGRFQRVPIITGVTANEFTKSALHILANNDFRKDLNENFELKAPICFLYNQNNSQNISNELKNAYLTKPLVMDESLAELGALYGDAMINFGVHRFVHLAANFTRIFYYKSTFIGRYSHLYYPGNKPYGVEHTDDLLYVLVKKTKSPIFNETDPEYLTIERMTRMWTNFAITGNPNNEEDEIIGDLRWTSFSLADENYLNIGNELIMSQNLFTERLRIWDRLFPLN